MLAAVARTSGRGDGMFWGVLPPLRDLDHLHLVLWIAPGWPNPHDLGRVSLAAHLGGAGASAVLSPSASCSRAKCSCAQTPRA
jgi:hypothetical protein